VSFPKCPTWNSWGPDYKSVLLQYFRQLLEEMKATTNMGKLANPSDRSNIGQALQLFLKSKKSIEGKRIPTQFFPYSMEMMGLTVFLLVVIFGWSI